MGPEWWRGSCNGHSGVFPCSYVEKINDAAPFVRGDNSSTPSFDSGYASHGGFPNSGAPWNGPGGNYGYVNNSYQPYSPQNMTPYDPYAKQQPHYQTTSPPPQAYTPVPPPVNTPAVAPPPIPEKKKFGGKLGGMMASSFAGGIGFGAGSAIASDAIHAIF